MMKTVKLIVVVAVLCGATVGCVSTKELPAAIIDPETCRYMPSPDPSQPPQVMPGSCKYVTGYVGIVTVKDSTDIGVSIDQVYVEDAKAPNGKRSISFKRTEHDTTLGNAGTAAAGGLGFSLPQAATSYLNTRRKVNKATPLVCPEGVINCGSGELTQIRVDSSSDSKSAVTGACPNNICAPPPR